MNKNEKEKNEVNDKNIKVNEDKNINNDEDKNYDVKVLHEIKIAYAKSGLDNTFAYVSFYDIPYLVFSSKEISIISYNLKELSVATEIKNAHENSISKFRSYEKNINTIYILSISSSSSNVKIWNFKNWECIFNLSQRHIIGSMFASIYISKDNKDYVITSSSNDSEFIRLFDFNGKEIFAFDDSQGKVLILDYLIDKNKYYIIAGMHNYVKAFNLDENKLYHKYSEPEFSDWHSSIKIHKSDDTVKLIDSCWGDDYLRIWDFHKGILLSKFQVGGQTIRSMCQVDDNCYYMGCRDHTIKLVDIKNEKVLNSFCIHKDWVVTIRKIKNSKFGECYASQGLTDKEDIKIWK